MRRLEASCRYVFSSDRNVNLELSESPKRNEAGYWILNYFPIRDTAGSVKLVGGVVVEITDQKKLRQLVCSVTDKLIRNLLLTAQSLSSNGDRR